VEDDLQLLPGRLEAVRARVAEAARRAGRAPESVTLLAVTKGKPVEAIRAALAAGQRDFGENYAQELEQKARELANESPAPRFHFIGQLQRNKVKQVVPSVATIQSVDRGELAAEIDKRAQALGLKVGVFAEVGFGEANKGGVELEALRPLVDAIRSKPALELRGLMTVPPDVDDPEEARPYFAAVRAWRDQHAPDLRELSMGMSHDFEVAIEEGATIVRVGTAIFGARHVA
jgi:pyridoxal phosphate enzyme (YggS family)